MRTSPSKILIVDDYHSNRVSLERLLESIENIQVFHADSGNSALKQLIHHQFTLILLDVNMPEMSGIEVLEQIKSNSTWTEIPVIFVTALDQECDEAEGLQKGAIASR